MGVLHLFAGKGNVGEKELSSCGKNLLVKSVQDVYLDDSRVCQDCLKEACLAPVADPSMAFEAKRLCVITGTKVVDTGRLSFAFLWNSGSFREMTAEFYGHYSHVVLRSKLTNNEVGPNALSDSDTYWDICVMQSGAGQIFAGGNELTLEELLLKIPKCNLLMQRDLFEHFEKVCQEVGIELVVHHFDGELKTS